MAEFQVSIMAYCCEIVNWIFFSSIICNYFQMTISLFLSYQIQWNVGNAWILSFLEIIKSLRISMSIVIEIFSIYCRERLIIFYASFRFKKNRNFLWRIVNSMKLCEYLALIVSNNILNYDSLNVYGCRDICMWLWTASNIFEKFIARICDLRYFNEYWTHNTMWGTVGKLFSWAFRPLWSIIFSSGTLLQNGLKIIENAPLTPKLEYYVLRDTLVLKV